MKKHKKMLWVGGFLAIGLAVVFVMNTSAQTAARKIVQQKMERPPLGRNLKLCPDLAVSRLNVSTQFISGQWWMVVDSNVTNEGNKDFISGPGQASAKLIFKRSWISGPGAYFTLDTRQITRLNKGSHFRMGGSFELSGFKKSDCTLPMKPGECCRELQAIVMVSYDPDILMDGNVDNDDCNAKNNVCPDVPANHIKYTITCLKKSD